MKAFVFVKSLALAVCLMATLAIAQPPDSDGDGVADERDNCSELPNPGQHDTDGDFCGNICDADYDQNGRVGFPDFGQFTVAFGTMKELYCHVEPIPGCTVGWPDYGMGYSRMFGTVPGPSGTTLGTTACP